MSIISDIEDALTGAVQTAQDLSPFAVAQDIGHAAAPAASRAQDGVVAAAGGVMDQVNQAADRASDIIQGAENALGHAVSDATNSAAHVVLAYLVLGAIVLVLGMALIWYLIRSGSIEHLIGIGATAAAVGAGGAAKTEPAMVPV